MHHIGIDVQKKESLLCILGEEGQLSEPRIRITPERFAAVLGTGRAPASSSRPRRGASGWRAIWNSWATRSSWPTRTSRPCTPPAPGRSTDRRDARGLPARGLPGLTTSSPNRATVPTRSHASLRGRSQEPRGVISDLAWWARGYARRGTRTGDHPLGEAQASQPIRSVAPGQLHVGLIEPLPPGQVLTVRRGR